MDLVYDKNTKILFVVKLFILNPISFDLGYIYTEINDYGCSSL